jgi:hypothetical protein
MKSRSTVTLLVLLAILLSLAVPPSPARAGGVVSVCNEAGLLGALSGGGTLTFTCSGTIVLTNTIPISEDTTIDGSGQEVTISGGGAVRVFDVSSGVTFNLNELTITGGSSDFGAGIYNWGTVVVSNSTFSGNSTEHSGSGILNMSSLTVSDSTISGNSASSDGGGIMNVGTATVSNSIFSGNSASNNGGGIYNGNGGTLIVSDSTFSGNNGPSGGGIYNLGSLSVSDSTFSGNSASSGGGIYNYSSLFTVSDSIFSENSASSGGGIMNRETASVNNSTFSGNSAEYWGGGIHNEGTLTMSDSDFSGNSAPSGGGIYNVGSLTVNNSTFSGNSANDGSGIYNSGSQLTVSDSTFSANTADSSGGGIISWGTVAVSNSTFSGNSADYGGGIYQVGSLTVSNCTFSENSAIVGGGIYKTGLGSLIVNDSILWNDTGGEISGSDTTITYSVIDGGYPGEGNTAEDPLLGPLQDNGGPTHTMALGPGSAAMDAGDNTMCAAEPVDNLDQCGWKRPVDGDGDGVEICDIGAFEYQRTPTETSITEDSPDPSEPGEPFTVSFEVTSEAGVPTGSVTVTASGSPAACSTGLVGGVGSCQLALDTPGAYTLRADYAGDEIFLPSSGTGTHTVEATAQQLYLPALRK